MKIAILGAGKMGSLVGSLLYRSGADVYLIDPWEAHINAINSEGLTVKINEDEPYTVYPKAFTSADQISEKMDMVIILVMGMYTESAVKASMNLIDENTYILTLQNGMGNVEKLEEMFPKEKIMYGIVPYGGNMAGPGRMNAIINLSAHAHFASDASEEPLPIMEEFASLMQKNGLNFRAEKKSVIDSAIWDKLAKNASSNGVCGLVRLPLGPYNDCDEGMAVKQALYDEVIAVAAAKGIKVAAPDELKISKGMKMYNHLSSSAQDVRDKKKTEIDFISGYIAREGARLGVPTPYNTIITQLIHIVEQNYDMQF